MSHAPTWLFIVLFALAFVIMAVGLSGYTKRRGIRLIQKWASENRLVIQQCKFDFFGRGPSRGLRNDGDKMFFVTAERPDGLILKGYVRCNVGHMGRYAGRVEPMWDEARGFEVKSLSKADEK